MIHDINDFYIESIGLGDVMALEIGDSSIAPSEVEA